MAKFIVPSYWFGTKKSYSNVKIKKDFTGISELNLHGLYGDDYILMTKKSAGYYHNFNIPFFSITVVRNLYPSWIDISNRKYYILHGCFVKREFLINNYPIRVLLGNLHRNLESFVFEQPIRNSSTVFIDYNFNNKMAYEYDIGGNEIERYNVFYGNKDFLYIAGGWPQYNKGLGNMFLIDKIVIWNKFNPLVEYPVFNINTQKIMRIIYFDKNISAKLIIGENSEIKFQNHKFVIVKPDDNSVYKIDDSGNFVDVTSYIDLNDYISFLNNSSPCNNYFKVDDTNWQTFMGTNQYLWFLCNYTYPCFILRYSSLNISDEQFLYIRYDDFKPILIKDNI